MSSIDLVTKYKNSKKISSNNNDSKSKVFKLDYIAPDKTNDKYVFVFHVNTAGKRSWEFIDAPKLKASLSKFGALNSDNQGTIYLEIDNPYAIPNLLDTVEKDLQFTLTSFFKNDVYSSANTPNPSISSKSLHQSAYDQDIKTIEKLLSIGKSKITDKDSSGDTILHIAYYKDNLKMAQTALSWGASVDATNSKGNNILSMAIDAGNYKWFEFAFKNGAYISGKDHVKNNIMHKVVKNYEDAIKWYSVNKKEKSESFIKIAKDLAYTDKDLVVAKNSFGKIPLVEAGNITYDDSAMFKVLVHEMAHDIHVY